MHIKHWQIIGAIFTVIVGSLLHFTYEWSGENPLVGIFSAVNESTWEHLKLLFIPFLLFSIFEYFNYGNQIQNFIPIKILSIFLGMSTIIIAFYTYVGIVGQNFLWADISIFILGVLVTYWFSSRFLHAEFLSSAWAVRFGWIGLLIMILSFIIFTFNPPHIGLFLDPISGTYGI
jgi:hypothetical protein